MTAAEEEIQLQQEDEARARVSFIWRLWRFFAALFFLAGSAHAATTTYGFETLGNCSTGQEAACQSDNGISLSPPSVDAAEGFKIKTCPVTAAVGTGCIYGSGSESGSGPGFFDETISTGTTESACLGFYVRFGQGYLQNASDTGNHASALKYSIPGDTACGGSSCCTGYITADWTISNPRIQVEVNQNSGCGSNAPSSFNLTMNEGNWVAKNNQWYHVEICSTLNTTASSTTGNGGGNGIVRMYVDGVRVLNYTSVNMRGASTTADIDSFFGARSYLGFGVARHKPNIYYDHFTISTDSITPVGPSGSANSLGTGDGPYIYYGAGDGMEQAKLHKDCNGSGTGSKYITSAWSEDWKSGKSFVTTPDNNDYACNATACPSCTTSNSLAATTSAANGGAGVYYAAGDNGSELISSQADGIYIHGHIYLDNLPTVSMALAGIAQCTSFNCSTGGSAVDQYLALTVTNGKWGLLPKTGGSVGTAHESTVTAVADTWTEFEIAVTDDNKCSLAIERSWVINEVPCNQAIGAWAVPAANSGYRFVVAGIIDSRTEAGAFTANYDDFDVMGASAWSTKGWAAASAPSGFDSGVPAATSTAPGRPIRGIKRGRK